MEIAHMLLSRKVMPNRFFSEKELQILLGVTVKTIQRWRMLGIGPPYRKLCGSVRYGLSEVEAWIAAQPTGGEGVKGDQRDGRR
jgi:predicted DNA-binding transcriptional regulator AlpA